MSNENKEKLLNLLFNICLKAPFTTEDKSALDKILRSSLFKKIVSLDAKTMPVYYSSGNIVSEAASKPNPAATTADNLQKPDKMILINTPPQLDCRLSIKSIQYWSKVYHILVF